MISSDDNSVPEDWPPKVAFELGVQALEQLGRIVPDGKWLEKLLVDAGFVDVQVKVYKQPFMAWPKQKDLKQAGSLYTLSAETVYHAYAMSLLTRVLGWSSEDADALCKSAYAAHLDKKSRVHAYTKL